MIFGKKIEKNNNAVNEFLGINTHENMIFVKKNFFASCRGVAIFSQLSKKGLTTRPKKTGLRFLIYSKKKFI